MTLDPKHVKDILARGGLYVLTGANLARGRTHREIVEAVIVGGADLIQHRDKFADARGYFETARDLHVLTERAGVPLIVNDRADVALAVGAEGLHVGQDDLPVAAARALATSAGRPDMVIGLSTHEVAQGKAGVTSGADYLGVGPIYKTKTKDYHVGIEYARWAGAHLTLPWTVSGGVNEQRLAEIAATGARWIVVIGAVNAANDIAAATRRLKSLWAEARANAATKQTTGTRP